MNNNLCVLIDIGGTAIKYGLSDFEGNFIKKGETPTKAKEFGGPGIVNTVKNIVKEYLKDNEANIKAVAVSTAGMVDPESCKIIYALPDAIPDYTGVNFKDIIKAEFNLPCFVENDVNCAALGEMWQGCAKGCHSVFTMTIGTSIGGAMICNDRLISGVSNSAGEIAYMRIPNGMLHELASTTYLVKTYAAMKNMDIKDVNGVLIFDNAQNGESEAIKAIDMLVENLSDGIVNVVSVQNPEAIILGGGIMARHEYLRPRIEKAIASKLKDVVFKATRIEFASLKNDAGMLGALFNLKQRM